MPNANIDLGEILRNIQLIIEYDGTNYVGWQIQKNGISIQQVIQNAVYKVMGELVSLTASGRTDSGVHAYGQSANFFTTCTIPTDKIPLALNSNLPGDIRIIKAYEKDMKFHSRYNALGKIYEYKILNSLVGTALDRDRVWNISRELDKDKMEKVLKHFIGTYDFTAFSSVHSSVKDKVRTINGLDMTNIDNEFFIFTIEGTGFLYNMVRIIVGTIVDVGLGRLMPDDIPEIINSKDRKKAGKTAPAKGLYLKEVLY